MDPSLHLEAPVSDTQARKWMSPPDTSIKLEVSDE